ncbi:hypothetical protein FH972_021986 [Carpinus fangiana]|uniref:RNA helicase n=1 Tax=Carpinus fangiana TaxID=176857 RepID=A0A5N6KRA4_9ROSI|nr:hypothetical protein FH972_021986 [Carpinus fangiana]
MARRGENRSRSPRRNGRRDDAWSRDRRDDGRLSYRPDRSPPNQVCLLDIKSDKAYVSAWQHRIRDRAINRDPYPRNDRRDGDYQRRQRSRDRYRSPDRSDGRGGRERSRDRGAGASGQDASRGRVRRDDSRDRPRRVQNEPMDAIGKSSTTKEGMKTTKEGTKTSKEGSKPPTTAGQDSPRPDPTPLELEEEKAARLARLKVWKDKLTAEREAKQTEQESPADASSHTPTTPGTPQEPASPAPYAGKFDPKEIARRAAATSTKHALLGDDVHIPKKRKTSGTLNPPNAPIIANTTQPSTNIPFQGKGHVSGFGFAAKAGVDLAAPKQTLGFGEEEAARKKLEKLPSPPPDDTPNGADQASSGAYGGAGEGDDDDDSDMENAGTEEEAAAAARIAAEKREERLIAESQAQQQSNADVEMVESPPNQPDQDDEEDPLDAYMATLSASANKAPGLSTASNSKGKQQAPETMFSDDDDELSTIKTSTDDILQMATMKAARKKKDIPTVDHSKMDYETFQKDFYKEPSELAKLTEEEVADIRLELDGIKIKGTDVAKPVRTWAQCGLGMSSLDVIRKLGYENPTSIQAQAIPVIMSGRDVIGVAKTGSGKTMAFLVPMFRHIKAQRPVEGMDGPIGLIVAPTRELATQIHKDCKPWLKALNLRAVCAYGGAPIKEQIAELKRGAEIVVCTAGRIIDLLAANNGRVTNLRRVTYLVLDEADRMFDMGFEPQITRILTTVRPERQTVLFSATFPRNMETLARKALQRPVEIIVGGRSAVAPEITQLVEVRADSTKFVRLLQLLGEIHEDDDARSLVFVDRQEAAEELMSAILKRGYPCFTIHGGKDQYDRDSVIADFKAGIFPVLVATSVAARGLDVKQLKMVVNFDCPNHLEDYVHRSGRTGRAGQKGLAVTFITEDQGRYALDVAKALRYSGQEVPEPVQKLCDSFLEKVKAGKEKAAFGTGFGGKGLERLEQDRDAARNRERSLYKTGDEPDETEDKKDAKESKDDIVVHASKPLSADEIPKPPAPRQAQPSVPNIDLDGQITVHKKETAEPTANRMDTVSAAVAQINARLRKAGDIRGNAPIDNKGPDAGLYHATLEINDFPQKARWACTNRTNVARILNDTGTSITTKGEFYPATRPPPGPTDPPKLYILVEGDTELAVTNAMRELMRSLKEGMAAAIEGEARAPASGRYSVI